MMGVALTALLSFLHRCCGAAWAKFPAEWVFALPFALGVYLRTNSVVWAVLAYAVTYAGVQLGHGNFYQMKGVTNDKPESIEWLARRIYSNIYTLAYSWLCMGLKGLVIGLATFPYGLSLGLLWPLSYAVGLRLQKTDTALAEYLAGACAGLTLWASL